MPRLVVLAENLSRPTPNANQTEGGSAGWTRKRLADFLCDAALVKRFTEFARRVDLVKRVTEFVRDAAVVAVIQRVTGGENQCDWPVDDLSGSQHSKADVVREFLRPGKVHVPDDGQIEGHPVRRYVCRFPQKIPRGSRCINRFVNEDSVITA